MVGCWSSARLRVQSGQYAKARIATMPNLKVQCRIDKRGAVRDRNSAFGQTEEIWTKRAHALMTGSGQVDGKSVTRSIDQQIERHVMDNQWTTL